MATIFKKGGKGPWVIKYVDHQGKRREHSAQTTDKRSADRMAQQLEAGKMLRRDGIIDPTLDLYAKANLQPLATHSTAYLTHLTNAGRAQITVKQYGSCLRWIIKTAKVSRISELTLDRVEGALAILKQNGKAARTINYRGAVVRSFLNWCVRTGRVGANPLRYLPTQNVAEDRRHERRVPTDAEVIKLQEVTESVGRWPWYAVAAYAGLRRGEMVRLTWGDVDFGRHVIVIKRSKSRRTNETVPLCCELHTLLSSLRPSNVLPSARVFAECPSNETRQRDFLRAGIERETDGKWCDLHSLRGWLATRLARAGVAPQVCMKIMRHANYATTLGYYTMLTGEDSAKAMASLPALAAAGPEVSSERREKKIGQ